MRDKVPARDMDISDVPSFNHAVIRSRAAAQLGRWAYAEFV